MILSFFPPFSPYPPYLSHHYIHGLFKYSIISGVMLYLWVATNLAKEIPASVMLWSTLKISNSEREEWAGKKATVPDTQWGREWDLLLSWIIVDKWLLKLISKELALDFILDPLRQILQNWKPPRQPQKFTDVLLFTFYVPQREAFIHLYFSILFWGVLHLFHGSKDIGQSDQSNGLPSIQQVHEMSLVANADPSISLHDPATGRI